ncbi:MAG: hypothetical protein ABI672_11525 [Vicinamibacteria bacterium]
MKRRDFTKAIAGIAAVVVAGSSAFAQDTKKPAEKPKEVKHECKGKNECKGQGGCKTGDAGCAGKNSCKGKGGCAVPAKKAEPKK